MMKKMNLILTMLILSAGITACGSAKKEPETTVTETTVDSTEEEPTKEVITEVETEKSGLSTIQELGPTNLRNHILRIPTPLILI